VAAGGEGRDGLGRRKGKSNGPPMGFWAAGRKRKRREREKDWASRTKICWTENVFLFIFSKPNKQIQFKFKLKDLNSKLNHKQ